MCLALPFDDVDNLIGFRAKDDISSLDEDEMISTPFGIDFDHA